MALGSDGGGSIRIPAAACGITGIKGMFKDHYIVNKNELLWVASAYSECNAVEPL